MVQHVRGLRIPCFGQDNYAKEMFKEKFQRKCQQHIIKTLTTGFTPKSSMMVKIPPSGPFWVSSQTSLITVIRLRIDLQFYSMLHYFDYQSVKQTYEQMQTQNNSDYIKKCVNLDFTLKFHKDSISFHFKNAYC